MFSSCFLKKDLSIFLYLTFCPSCSLLVNWFFFKEKSFKFVDCSLLYFQVKIQTHIADQFTPRKQDLNKLESSLPQKVSLQVSSFVAKWFIRFFFLFFFHVKIITTTTTTPSIVSPLTTWAHDLNNLILNYIPQATQV